MSGRTKCPDRADGLSGGHRTPYRDGVSVRPLEGVRLGVSARRETEEKEGADTLSSGATIGRTDCPAYLVEIASDGGEWGTVPIDIRLRRALKSLLRAYGFRVVAIRRKPQEDRKL